MSGRDPAISSAEIRALATRCAEPIETRPQPVPAIASRGYAGPLDGLRRRLSAAPTRVRRLSSVEWFLDNTYVLAETAQTLPLDLPASLYRTLPAIADDGRPLPRVYLLARALLRQTSSAPDRGSLQDFLTELQTHVPLCIHELWTFPALLRAACLESIVTGLSALDLDPTDADENEPPPGPEPPPSLTTGPRDSDEVVLAIQTLIALKTISWRKVFEHCSLVHAELSRDPAGVYEHMDFATRDRYRRVVQDLARRAGCDELRVARQANETATSAWNTHIRDGGEADARRRHVGYFLIDDGRAELTSALGVGASWTERLSRGTRRVATLAYLASIAGTTLAVLTVLAVYLRRLDAAPSTVALGCAMALMPASSLAVAWVQWLLTRLTTPTRLPRLALKAGLGEALQTVVVIPTLFGDADEVRRLVERLERHYLGNPDPHLQFALLADYTDALTASTSADPPLLAEARRGIERLNRRYQSEGVGPFHVLIRARRFNPSEGVWMGWERKRGKLEEFNRYLTGRPGTTFDVHIGERSRLRDIRFVITVDSDTELPRDSARRLVAILAHPLNRAIFQDGRVTAGYTVLQPRIDVTPNASHHSHFSRIFAGDTGLDIYSRAVSNVYQDVFGTGVYVGKGIYDVDAFRRCLEGQVPENALLSHDLFEGLHARVGLVTDVVLYEGYPGNYLAYARRLHRWIRGDWQLLPWLGFRVPGRDGGRIANPLTHIDRWKLLDNLRRSVTPVGLLGLLVGGWTWLPGSALVWTFVVVALSSGHVATMLASHLLSLVHRHRAPMRATPIDLPNDVLRWLMSLAFLPHEAVLVLDAVGRTVARVVVTRRRLLEWTAAAHTESLLTQAVSRRRWWREMLIGPVCAICVLPVVMLVKPDALAVALVVAVVWGVSPEVALWLARPRPSVREALTPGEQRSLRTLARRTWLFFETFVGPDDHWLPPDNVQLVPSLRVARRTSPTNIGLYLASCATACDLGYLELADFCLRTKNTLSVVGELERHRGQLLNWYETSSLQPLAPKYVSTVDNGNLAASLIALGQTCTGYMTGPVLRPQSWAACEDVATLFELAVSRIELTESERAALDDALIRIRQAVSEAAANPAAGMTQLELLTSEITVLADLLASPIRRGAASTPSAEYEALDWLDILERQLAALRLSLTSLAGWYFELCAPPARAFPDAGLRRNYRLLRARAVGARLDELDTVRSQIERFLTRLDTRTAGQDVATWAEAVRRDMATACEAAGQRRQELSNLRQQVEAELARVDFRFLYDQEAEQLFIGYDASSSQPDRHHYDLLASEARLASLVGMALGQVPTRHWAHLGRPVAKVAGHTALLSWSGTMFEYLMPLLFTHSFPKTLLGRSTVAAVERQIQYAQKHRVPWGISESAFASTDSKGDYQYRAFGTPGLGLKRGLEDDLVVAPYASLLAVGVRPRAVIRNIASLTRLGAAGEYGLLEAIDFTPGRGGPLRGELVQAYMAHHQGMGLVALGNLLAPVSLVTRFHADPRIQTVAHLLQERVPPESATLALPEPQVSPHPRGPLRAPTTWKPPTVTLGGQLVNPATHLLSNGRLSLLGDRFGHSRLFTPEVEVRPRELGTPPDTDGSFCLYVQLDDDPVPHILSGAVVPGGGGGDVTFWPHAIETLTPVGPLTVHDELFLAPHDDIEIRRIRLTNESRHAVVARVTGYADVALQDSAEHHRHPAFSRLFLEASVHEQGQVLVCRRRPRGPDQRFPVLAQAVVTEKPPALSWETSRAAFIGRGRSARNPLALVGAGALSCDPGGALDRCLAQQVALRVEAGATADVAWVTSVGPDEQQALAALWPYRHLSALSDTREEAQRAMQHRLHRLDLAADDVATGQALLSQLIHRPSPIRQGPRRPPDRRQLWAHGISGDRPVLLLHRHAAGTQVTELILRLHRFFDEQGLLCDLVIVVHEATGYADEAREQIRRVASAAGLPGLPRGVTVLATSHLQADDIEALESAASVVLRTHQGAVAGQLAREMRLPKLIAPFTPPQPTRREDTTPPLERRPGLAFDDGFGGFAKDGTEFIIFLTPGSEPTDHTPAPWTNVLANPTFGCLVTERGLGGTWAQNASENRLTPWSNDPVSDPPAEAIYFREEESGAVWSPTPGPMPAPSPYEVTHGIGYTRFRHRSHRLDQTVRVLVHPREPLKICEITLTNLDDCRRRLTATYFADWILGGRRATSGPGVVQRYVPEARALLASTRWNVEHPDQVAFLATSEHVHGFTTDRVEFLGTGGVSNPDALHRWGLSNSEISGTQSAGVMNVHVDLDPAQSYTLRFALGWGVDADAAEALAAAGTHAEFLDRATQELAEAWGHRLGQVRVSTPEPAIDIMLNTWAQYQTLSSRVFGRTGFYQSSGAIGFRDQLQDALALCLTSPDLARAQILLAAGHQFEAGDVLHWWHPPRGPGIRSRCSDDLVWLPYVTAHYVETTGDTAVLDEGVPFLVGAELAPDEVERYALFDRTQDTAPLSEHCLRALDRARAVGPHGLPLIGSGDWNDGMNLVGAEGIGESVWLGWFLVSASERFARVCPPDRGGKEAQTLRAEYRTRVPQLEAAWDGAWYHRAYYDDGTPLGSASGEEARIDSISQSWAVLSGAARTDRARCAVASAVRELVDEDARLVRLLWPPFDRDPHQPGYIKGYPPGVRENGAQYTHAAIWLVWALFELGELDTAQRLFRMLNPVGRAHATDEAMRYAVEPYVLAADIYSTGPHRGRGGWSWYTGSAAWFWRLGLEQLLGVQVKWPYLTIAPKIPQTWPSFTLHLTLGAAAFDVTVSNPDHTYDGVVSIAVDGHALATPGLDLRQYEGHHEIALTLGQTQDRDVALIGPGA